MLVLIWVSPWLIFIFFIIATYLRFFTVADYAFRVFIAWTLIYPAIGILIAQLKEQKEENREVE